MNVHRKFVYRAGNPIEALFAEELGLVLEVSESHLNDVVDAYKRNNIPCFVIGHSVGSFGSEAEVKCFMTDLSRIKFLCFGNSDDDISVHTMDSHSSIDILCLFRFIYLTAVAG